MAISEETKQRGILLLAAGKKNKDIAEQLGISMKTVERWRKDPHISEMIKNASREACEAGISKFASLFNSAAEKIEQIMNDPKAPQRLQLEAAKMIINYALESRRSQLEELKAIEILVSAGYLSPETVNEISEGLNSMQQRVKSAIAKGKN